MSIINSICISISVNTSLSIFIRDSKSLKVEIILSNQFITKFNNSIDLLVDIYKTLGELKCDRIDFFVNPDTRVSNLFDIVNETVREIIKILVNNRYYKGGNCSFVPPGQSIEDMIDTLRELIATCSPKKVVFL